MQLWIKASFHIVWALSYLRSNIEISFNSICAMKHLLPILAISLFFQTKLSAQIISNGSFESGISESWTHQAVSGQATFAQNTAQAREGQKCLRVQVTQTGTNPAAIRSRNSSFLNTGESIYLLQFWAKSASGDANLYVKINGDSEDVVHYKIRPFWKLYKLPFDTDAPTVDLFFGYTDAKTYFIDGVEILDQNSGPIDVQQTFKWNEKFAPGWGWTAGDNDISLKLPDGRTLYVFNDSFYGYNDPTDNEFHNDGARFLRNAMVIEEAYGLLHSFYAGTQQNTTVYFETIEPSPVPGTTNFYWVGDMVMESGKVLVYLVELYQDNDNVYTTNRTYLATFNYPGLQLEGITKQEPFANGYEAFFPDGNYMYLYRTETVGFARWTHVARCAKGDLLGKAGTWEYYTGTSWSPNIAESDTVNRIGADGFVKLGPNNYAQIAQGFFSRDIRASFAPSPEGPWSKSKVVYTRPEEEETWSYLPNIHRQLPNGKYQIDYSMNSFEGWADAWKDKYWYRQHYVQINLLGLSPYTSFEENLALNKPVTASSTENNTLMASNTVDGLFGTRWSSNYTDTEWIYVDLGDFYNVSQINLIWETALAKDYQLKISNDAIHWQTVQTIEGNTYLKRNHSSLDAVARYVGVYCTKRATIWGYSLKEFQVFGEPAEQMDITDLGGTITDQLNNSPFNGGIANLIDNNPGSKFLTFGANIWVRYEGISKYIVESYTMTSGNDAPERDPFSWFLQGSNNGSTWKNLDVRNNEDFPQRNQKRTFEIAGNTEAYKYFRLKMSNNSGNKLQLAEWELFGFCADSRLQPDAPYLAEYSGLEVDPESGNHELSPYPVPFHDQLRIPLSPEYGLVSIEIYDLRGALIQSSAGIDATSNSTYQMDSSMWAAGLYLVKVQPNNGSEARSYKVVKE